MKKWVSELAEMWWKLKILFLVLSGIIIVFIGIFFSTYLTQSQEIRFAIIVFGIVVIAFGGYLLKKT